MADDSVQIVGIDRLIRRFGRAGRLLISYEVLNEMGEYLTTAIRYRTLAGKEIGGQPFAPYTERYRKFRLASGRSGTPNLFFTGSMLNSMTYVSSLARDEVKVFFMEGTDRSGMSNPAKAFYLQNKRPFFGASAEDISKINEIYREHVRELIGGRK